MELFKYPVAALWLAAGFAALLFLRQSAAKTRLAIAEKVLGRKMILALRVRKNWARAEMRGLLLLTALFFAALAAGGPQWGVELARVSDLNGNLVIAVDTSLSMSAKDLKPSRLENAKLMLAALAEKFPDYRLGVVAFAGQAYIQCPLTTDLDAIKYFISTLSPGMLPSKGTDLPDAIETSGRMLAPYGGQKVMVLITDGEDHSKNLDRSIKDAAAAGLRIFTVGIGRQEGELIAETGADGSTPGYKKDASGKTVVTRLNEQALLKIAAGTGGAYLRYSDPDAAAVELRSSISRLSLTKTKGFGRANFKNRYQWPLLLAILALLLELLIMENLKRTGASAVRLPALKAWFNFFFTGASRPGAAALFLAAIFFPPGLWASGARALAVKGNAAYGKKNYSKALEYYGKAAGLAPGNKKIIFNSGDVLYRLENYPSAAEAFAVAASSFGAPSSLSRRARYNEANAYFMQGDYARAVESYRSAVLADPKDEKAKYNLQRALERLQESKKNQSKNDKKDKDKDKDSKNKEQQEKKPGGDGDKEKQRQKDEEKKQADRLLEMMKDKEKSPADREAQMLRFDKKQRRENPAAEDW